MESERIKVPCNRSTNARLFIIDEIIFSIRRSWLFCEYYKRYELKDIQALVVQKTKTNLILLIVYYILGVLCLFTGLEFFYWVSGCLFLPLIIYSHSVGTSCKTYIRTPVHYDRLYSFNSVKRARAGIKFLVPYITERQGELAENEEIVVPVSESLNKKRRAKKKKSVKTQIKKSTYAGGVHYLSYFLFLIIAIISGIGSQINSLSLLSTFIGFVFLATITLLISLIRQNNSLLSVTTKKTTWWSSGYIGVLFLVGYFWVLRSSFAEINDIGSQLNTFKYLGSVDPKVDPLMRFQNIANCLIMAVLGMWGISSIRTIEDKPVEETAQQPHGEEENESSNETSALEEEVGPTIASELPSIDEVRDAQGERFNLSKPQAESLIQEDTNATPVEENSQPSDEDGESATDENTLQPPKNTNE